MALKKSQLYSSLWQSADELRGGMDASQYKDYVLTLLFMKDVSDKAKSSTDSLASTFRTNSPDRYGHRITALKSRRDTNRAIKQGMMQQLLTGRVRLAEQEAMI